MDSEGAEVEGAWLAGCCSRKSKRGNLVEGGVNEVREDLGSRCSSEDIKRA